MSLCVLSFLLLTAFVQNSLQLKCYECTSYKSQINGPLTKSWADVRLCPRQLNDSFVVDCQGSSCSTVIFTPLDLQTEITYRSCSNLIDCSQYPNNRLCKSCDRDKCNGAPSITTSTILTISAMTVAYFGAKHL